MRFFGEVGYGESIETSPGSGKWTTDITESTYQGDIIHNVRPRENVTKVNNDVSVSNVISIVGDDKAFTYFNNIKYVNWGGVLWIVTSVEVQRPRLILILGGVYNGPTP